MTQTTKQASPYRCTDWVSRGRVGGGRCGKPADKAIKKVTGRGSEAESVSYEPRCNFHVSVERRAYERYSSRDAAPFMVYAIENEVKAAIDDVLAEEARRKAEADAAKRIENARLTLLARERAAEDAAQEWVAVRDDDETYDWSKRVGGEVPTIKVPRWGIDPKDHERSFHEMEVTVKEHFGQQVLEVRNASRLTPNAAAALIEALQAALKEVTK